jgi:hypothetical protein
LIEHFDHEGTTRIIAAHFANVKPGGTVFITFPTPTRLYRIARKVIELLGLWIFHDERPLGMNEVVEEANRHGDLLHSEINWWILLTQGIVVYRVR